MYAALTLLLQTFSVIYLSPSATNKSGDNPNWLKTKIDLIAIQILSLAVVIIAPYTDGRAIGVIKAGDWARVAGLLIMTTGFILMQIAEK